MIRSNSKIDEDWEGKIKREGKDLEREREKERERERERNKRGTVVQGDKVHVGVFKKKHTVTLSPTTKIFVLENELTKKEIRV